MEAGDHVHRLAHDPKEQRIRKSSAPSAADVSVDNGEMLWRRSNPVDDPLDFRCKANGQFRIAGAIPITRGSVQPVQRNQKRPTARSAPLSKLGLKLVPRNAAFSVLIETCDVARLAARRSRVCPYLKALPEVLDQIEPLARREPSQLGREITHVVQNGERKRVGQFASPRQAPARPLRRAACQGHGCALPPMRAGARQ